MCTVSYLRTYTLLSEEAAWAAAQDVGAWVEENTPDAYSWGLVTAIAEVLDNIRQHQGVKDAVVAVVDGAKVVVGHANFRKASHCVAMLSDAKSRLADGVLHTRRRGRGLRIASKFVQDLDVVSLADSANWRIVPLFKTGGGCEQITA